MTGLACAEDERDHRDVARALADRREDAVDLRARDRAPLELQPLGDGERRRGRAEEREDDQGLGQPRHNAASTALEPAHEDERLRVLAAAAAP